MEAPRLRAIAPFALAGMAGFVALAFDSGMPRWAVWTMAAGTVGAIVTAVGCPWPRLPRRAQQLPAQIYLAGVLSLLFSGQEAIHPYVPLVLLPLIWLALYEPRVVVAVDLAVVVGALAIHLATVSPRSPDDVLHDAVLVALTLCILPTVNRLVAEAHQSEARFRQLADGNTDVIYQLVMEPVPHLDYVSPSIQNLIGYPPSAFLEDPGLILRICHPDDLHLLAQDPASLPPSLDVRWITVDGAEVITEHHITVLDGGNGIQGVARDVTEIRRLERALADEARRDPLTGLANRRLLGELAEPALARARRRGETLLVAFVDLDRFKEVNDDHGHDAGDAVLIETAKRLQQAVRESDVVARLGGDEFVLVMESGWHSREVLVERIIHSLEQPIPLPDGTAVPISASVGFADTNHAHTLDALLQAADNAMYEIKRSRRTPAAVSP